VAAPAAASAVIRVEGLTKVFKGGVRALDGVSLEVHRGEFVCVIGPSGSGKSTLLRTLNRLVDPDAGRVWVGGEEVTALSGDALRQSRRRTAMVFQQFNLVRRSTVLANVLTGRLGHQRGLRRLLPGYSAADQDLAWRSLQRMEIEEKAAGRADQLSGGQMQRVALARALAQEPEVLLADEPVASLDPETAVVVLDYLRDINRQDGITVLCAMHHLDLAKRYADRIVAMRRGKVVYDGTPVDLDPEIYQRIYGRLGFD
jgi:phosphonate transport system ATP-binding protein